MKKGRMDNTGGQMKDAVEWWIETQKEKLQTEPITAEDLDGLMDCLQEPRQQVLYLYSKSTNIRSAIASWARYDPTRPQEPTLPSQELPYASVLEAMADGWRIVQFPISKLYTYEGVDNDYLGFEFVLEKWI
jgi:hypothetical protein